MLYRLAADGLVLFHLCFILFVLFGGLLALKWRPVMWLHLPAAVWGVAVEVFTCPARSPVGKTCSAISPGRTATAVGLSSTTSWR